MKLKIFALLISAIFIFKTAGFCIEKSTGTWAAGGLSVGWMKFDSMEINSLLKKFRKNMPWNMEQIE